MEEDHLKINKFLALLPDTQVQTIFSLLDKKIIKDDRLELIEEYLLYVKDIGLPFKNKTLKTSHLNFSKSLNTLNDFIDESFSPRSTGSSYVLQPDNRENGTELWKKSVKEFKILLEDSWNKYGIFRTVIEKHLLGDSGSSRKIPEEKDKKYSDINEPILLNTLAITIEDEYVFFKKKKERINPADRAIIKYLYYRFVEEEKQCVKIDVLVKDLGLAEGYLKNRICKINQIIKELVLDGRTKTNLDDFIKNERGRGYHLNPRYVTHFTKKK